MAHIHSVYDTDTHFSIDPINRKMKNESSIKTQLIQYDHNSERFTFEMPRYVEGHDMMTCNRVEIQFLNIDAVTKAQNKGLYLVDDLQLSPADENIVICSWLISQAATQLVGSLNFLVRFMCCSNPDIVDYSWNTAIHSSISVSSGINATDEIAEDYVDILESWRADIEGVKSSIGNMAFEIITKSAYDELGAVELNKAYYVVDENTGKVTLYLGGIALAGGTDISGDAVLVANGAVGDVGVADYATTTLWNYWQEDNSDAKTSTTITASPTAECMMLVCVMHQSTSATPYKISVDGETWEESGSGWERIATSQQINRISDDGFYQYISVWKKPLEKGTYDITVQQAEELKMSVKAIAIYNTSNISVVNNEIAEAVPITPTGANGNRRLYLLSSGVVKSGTDAIEATYPDELDMKSAQEEGFTAFYDYQPEIEATPSFNFCDADNYIANTINLISIEFDTNPYKWAGGTAIALTDAADALFKEFKIYGKSTQNGTPTPENPIEIVNLDAVTNGQCISVNDYMLILNLPEAADSFMGIPVSSGGIYTDENGQQWLCDYIDVIRCEYVQMIGKAIIDGSGYWNKNGTVYYKRVFDYVLPSSHILCDAYKCDISATASMADKTAKFSFPNSQSYIYFKNDDIATADAFAAQMNANPVTVLYALPEPIRTSLSDTEMAMFKDDIPTLSTGTAISNSMGAYMRVKYQVKGD